MWKLLVVALISLNSFAAPELSDRICVEKLHGPNKKLQVIRAVGGKEEMVAEGENLFVGDTVVTAKGQIAQLSAFDKSAWAVAPESRLKLEARKPDPKSLSYWVFDLAKGAMWGEVPKNEAAQEGFRLKTKTKLAAMGIRGTEYLLGGSEQLSTLDVLQGAVWWGKSAEFAPGTYQEVKAGQHAEMGPDGKIAVRPSSGDKGALAKLYGVAPEGAGAADAAKKRSKDECRTLGKGWQSLDGSSLGECLP